MTLSPRHRRAITTRHSPGMVHRPAPRSLPPYRYGHHATTPQPPPSHSPAARKVSFINLRQSVV